MDAGLWLAVFLGTGLGGWTRAAVSAHLTQRFPGPWPWGTLTVNLFGSFLIGILTAYSFTWEGPGRTLPLLFAVTGFCGGVTTYSTLAWQTVGLWQEKDRGRALAFYGLNIGGALVLVLVGFWIGGWYA